jgi:hypothetical protein
MDGNYRSIPKTEFAMALVQIRVKHCTGIKSEKA